MSRPLPAAVRDRVARTAVRPSWLAVGAVTLLAPVVPSLPAAVVYAPLALSAVVLGLPHGAVDHLVPARLGAAGRLRSVAAVGALYAVLMAAYAAGWLLAPTAAFVAFVLLTWVHWGQGDLYAMLAFTGADHLPTVAERALALVVRGGLPVVVPLVVAPARYRTVARAVVARFGADAAALAPLFAPVVRAAVGGGLLAASLLGVALGHRRVRAGAPRGPWRHDVGEVALLWVFFAAVPPVLAVGVYFSLWHALRHVGRLAVVDDAAAAALARGQPRPALVRVARDAAPPTAGALLLLAGLAAAAPGP